jgi:hypothetical protein
MKIETLIEKCKKNFPYQTIVDEESELVDYGSIVEFVVCELAKELLDEIGITKFESY